MEELTVPFLGRDRAQRQFPFGDLVRSGVKLTMGSDWSVTTADPFAQIEVAVTRVGPDTRGGKPFLPEQAISPLAAMSAFTAGSAWLNHDADAGFLEPGKRADLAVLEGDPLDAREPIGDARVAATIASGQIVHNTTGEYPTVG